MAAKNLISNSHSDINFPTKSGKTIFQKEIFHKIWLIVGDYKYNYMAEIKIAKCYSVALLWGKQILEKSAKNANLC